MAGRDESIFRLIKERLITLEEGLKVAQDRAELTRRVQRILGDVEA